MTTIKSPRERRPNACQQNRVNIPPLRAPLNRKPLASWFSGFWTEGRGFGEVGGRQAATGCEERPVVGRSADWTARNASEVSGWLRASASHPSFGGAAGRHFRNGPGELRGIYREEARSRLLLGDSCEHGALGEVCERSRVRIRPDVFWTFR